MTAHRGLRHKGLRRCALLTRKLGLETDVMIARCGAGHSVINSPQLGWNLVGCANSTTVTHGMPRIRPAGAWIKGRGNERGRCWLCGHRNGVDRLRPQPVKCPREPFDPDDK